MNNKILIAEDYPAVSFTIRLLLASEGYDVVAEVKNGADALELVESLRPSIMILDIGLPVIDGLTVIRKVFAKKLPVKIIVFTGLPSSHLMTRCRRLGVHGFVSKQRELGELVYAVRAVRAHREYFPDMHILSPASQSEPGEQVLLELLSVREFGVMQQVLMGVSNKELAGHLQLSPKAVSNYKTRLLRKLDLRTVADFFVC